MSPSYSSGCIACPLHLSVCLSVHCLLLLQNLRRGVQKPKTAWTFSRAGVVDVLSVPRVRTCFGSRSFAVAAPTIWNTLPLYTVAIPLLSVVFIATSKHFSATQFFGHLSPQHTPCASHSAGFSCGHCTQYKFTYLPTLVTLRKASSLERARAIQMLSVPVSYTHLTLPTILRV